MKHTHQLHPSIQTNSVSNFLGNNSVKAEGNNPVENRFIHELEQEVYIAKLGLMPFLKGLSTKDVIAMLNQLDLSDRRLDFLLAAVSIDSEENEICEAIKIIKNNRKPVQNNDQTDHLNYLDL